MSVTWKPVGLDEISVPTTYLQSSQVAKTGPGSWKLVSSQINANKGYQEEVQENVLAVYILTGRSRKVFQKARLYFFVDLGAEIEVGSIAALMGATKWHANKGWAPDARRSWFETTMEHGPAQVT